MKKLLTFVAAACMAFYAGAQSLSVSSDQLHWNGGTLVIDTPKRPAGQTDVIQLTAPKLETVRVAFVGLGMRGPGAVARWTSIQFDTSSVSDKRCSLFYLHRLQVRQNSYRFLSFLCPP